MKFLKIFFVLISVSLILVVLFVLTLEKNSDSHPNYMSMSEKIFFKSDADVELRTSANVSYPENSDEFSFRIEKRYTHQPKSFIRPTYDLLEYFACVGVPFVLLLPNGGCGGNKVYYNETYIAKGKKGANSYSMNLSDDGKIAASKNYLFANGRILHWIRESSRRQEITAKEELVNSPLWNEDEVSFQNKIFTNHVLDNPQCDFEKGELKLSFNTHSFNPTKNLRPGKYNLKIDMDLEVGHKKYDTISKNGKEYNYKNGHYERVELVDKILDLSSQSFNYEDRVNIDLLLKLPQIQNIISKHDAKEYSLGRRAKVIINLSANDVSENDKKSRFSFYPFEKHRLWCSSHKRRFKQKLTWTSGRRS